MLTGVEVDNPSEALAIVSFPLDLLKAIISIPATALAIKVQNYAAEQNLNDSQTKLLQSQISLLQAQAAAQQARAGQQMLAQ